VRSPARTIVGDSSSEDSFVDDGAQPGPSRQRAPFVVQTDNFEVLVDPAGRPGKPKLQRKGSDGRSLSGVPPDQSPPEALSDWVKDQAQRTQRGDFATSQMGAAAQATPPGYRTRSGRTVRPPSIYDPSDQEELDRARRQSFGSARKPRIDPEAPGSSAESQPGYGGGQQARPPPPGRNINPRDEATQPAHAEGSPQHAAERDDQGPQGPDASPDPSQSDENSESTTSGGSEPWNLDVLFGED